MAIDKEAIKEHIRGILVALGDDPNREGLKETPDRVAKMYEEVFEGMNYTNKEIADQYCISIHTVISHRKNIARKTGIKSVSGLTVYALLNRMIDQQDIE